MTGEGGRSGAEGRAAGSSLDVDAVFARDMAGAAGRIQRDRYERVERIDHKSAKDVVTDVDHRCEALILGTIRERFPDDGILAEESGAHRGPARRGRGAPAPGADDAPARGPSPGAVDAPDRGLAHGRTWVVDPLDGTINYANGIPFFCVSIALLIDGRPAVGVVHDPMRGETYWATADGEAHLGDRPVAASDKTSLEDYVVAMALAGRRVTTRARAVRRAIRVSRNMGSAALALAYVANGRFDAFIQSAGMSAWDVAAAGLIAERAGATVTALDGGPWFDVDRSNRAFGLIAAPSAHHRELLRLTS
jgi:myo-inositol-1(or 4)-monophosphatase